MQVQVLFSAPNKTLIIMTTLTPITFGTSGHRGIIAKSFTTDHTRAIAQALATLLHKTEASPKVGIGYDSRTGNSPTLEEGSYTKSVVDTLLDYGVSVCFCNEPTPTPVISWAIEHHNWDGGLILTASHNPPNYNGIKFNPSDGAPAPVETTKILESLANSYLLNPPKPPAKKGTLTAISLATEFASSMHKKLKDLLPNIDLDLQPMSIIADALHGSVAASWDALFQEFNLMSYQILHPDPRADFGNIEPNPTAEKALETIRKELIKHPVSLSVANDPDGDRHVILTEKGIRLKAEEVALIILDFLQTQNVPVGGIATTLASSNTIATSATHHQLSYLETSVGFKYFTPFLKKMRNSNKVGIAVESSGGFSTSFHTLEKCGFLPVILLLLDLKTTQKSLTLRLSEIRKKYGNPCFTERAISLTESQKNLFLADYLTWSTQKIQSIWNDPIQKLNKQDGLKIQFEDNSWLLIRPSGTEPVLRVYAESASESDNLNRISALESTL